MILECQKVKHQVINRLIVKIYSRLHEINWQLEPLPYYIYGHMKDKQQTTLKSSVSFYEYREKVYHSLT